MRTDQTNSAMKPCQSHTGSNQHHRSSNRQLMNSDVRKVPNSAHGRGQVTGYQNKKSAPRSAFSALRHPIRQLDNGITIPYMFNKSKEDETRKNVRNSHRLDHSTDGDSCGAPHGPAASEGVRGNRRDPKYLRHVELIQDKAIVRYRVSKLDNSDRQSTDIQPPVMPHWSEQVRQVKYQETTEEWAARIAAARKTYEAARSFEDDHEFLAGFFDGDIDDYRCYSLSEVWI